MIEASNNIVKIEGTSKTICTEFTHIVVHIIQTFEKEFELDQQQAICVINECCKIAYMDDESRSEYLRKLIKEE